MSTTSAAGIIPRDQTPYFIIHGEECCLTWLIKQILLIFQSCRQQDTINTYITSFGSINIQWLSQSQIEGLPAERIEQLGLEQLNAFSDTQISYFTNSQRAAFEGALRQGGIVHQTLDNENIDTLDEISASGSTESEIEVDGELEVVNDLLVRTRFSEFLDNPIVREQVDPYLSDKMKLFLSNPKVRVFFTSLPHFANASMMPENHPLVYNNFLSRYSVLEISLAQSLLDINESPAQNEEFKNFLLSLLSDEDREVLNREEINSLSNFVDVCSDIRLNDIKTLKILITPHEELAQMSAREVAQLTPAQAAVLSLKLNGWLETTQEAAAWITREREPATIDEATVVAGTIPSLTLREFRSLSSNKINSLLSNLPPRFMSLLSPVQLHGLATLHLSQEQVDALFAEPADPVFGTKLQRVIDIFLPLQIKNMQDRLSGSILRRLSTDQTRALDVTALTQPQVDEWINNYHNRAAMLQKLTPDQIPQIQAKLTGNSLRDLSENHTHALNVETLTQPQVNDWINDYPSSAVMLAKLAPDQTPHIQAKLSGNSLRHLSVAHTRALNTGTLTQPQVNRWINDHHDYAAMLARLHPDQIPQIRDKLTSTSLGALFL